MAFIEWEQKYNLGIEIIDTQHQGLLELINQLYKALADGNSNNIVSNIFIELKNYTVTHFSEEERIFEKIDYSDRAKHIEEHLNFVKEINKLEQELINGKSVVKIKLIMFLRDWWLGHIQGSDRNYISEYNFYNRK